MSSPLNPHSPSRIFGFSIIVTLLALLGSWLGLGAAATLTVGFLIIIEIVFSFENAVINAKVLQRLSKFWQAIFLSIGIIIAVFGMRVVFPIVVVMATTGLSWSAVLDMALNQPDVYADKLHHAHPQIAAFGGSFLLALGLFFFINHQRTLHWWHWLESRLHKLPHHVSPPIIVLVVVALLAVMTGFSKGVLTYGIAGVATYTILYALTHVLEKRHEKKEKQTKRSATGLVGWAALSTFLYLEVLDASFSFDGVIGAFAITKNIILIAIGLGVGAVWVRSLTIFMIRRGTLKAYRYLEHGAHYTVIALALTMFASIFVPIPEWLAGGLGVILISASILASRQSDKSTIIKREA